MKCFSRVVIGSVDVFRSCNCNITDKDVWQCTCMGFYFFTVQTFVFWLLFVQQQFRLRKNRLFWSSEKMFIVWKFFAMSSFINHHIFTCMKQLKASHAKCSVKVNHDEKLLWSPKMIDWSLLFSIIQYQTHAILWTNCSIIPIFLVAFASSTTLISQLWALFLVASESTTTTTEVCFTTGQSQLGGIFAMNGLKNGFSAQQTAMESARL